MLHGFIYASPQKAAWRTQNMFTPVFLVFSWHRGTKYCISPYQGGNSCL